MEDSKTKLSWDEAIKIKNGPMLVIAGPGTGKTYTLTHKIKELVNSNSQKNVGIIISTFTRKATEELNQRLYELIDNEALLNSNLLVGTIHSICHELLMTYFDEKFSEYEIMSEENQINFIRSKLINLGYSGPDIKGNRAWKLSEDLATFFNHITDQQIDIYSIHTDDNEFNEALSKYSSYKKLLAHNKLFDFATIQEHLLISFKKHPETLEQIQKDFTHYFIDEYQDVNEIQDKIFKTLSSINYNLTVVGDDDQSIYGFRGSNVELIKSFQKEMIDKYGSCNVLYLNTNYRSTPSIVKLTNQIIDKSEYRRLSKSIKANREKIGSTPLICELKDDVEEAELIVNAIKTYISKYQGNYSDICILFRSVKSHSEKIKLKLYSEKIPFNIYSGGDFFNLEIGFEFITLLDYLLSKDDNPIDEFLSSIEEFDSYSGTNITSYYNDQTVLNNLLKKKQNLNKYKSCLGLFYDLCSSFEWLNRFESEAINIGKISGIVENFDEYSDYFDPFGLYGYLFYLKRNNKVDIDYEENDDRVNLMTIHQSKGLEFSFVIMASQMARSTPTSNSPLEKLNVLKNAENLEKFEERRIFYVGCTRARDLLLITYSKNLTNRKKRYYPLKYIEELKENYQTNIQISEFFTNFIGSEVKKRKKVENVLLSYNKLKLYQTCPLQYKFQNIWQLATVRVGGIAFGSNVHKILEVILNRISTNDFKFQESEVSKLFKTYWNSSQFRSKKEDQQYQKAAFNQIINFLNKRKKSLKPENIFKVEDPFNLKIDNVLISGKIDFILKENEKYEIIDFKTGEKRDYSGQLTFYSYCFNQKYNIEANSLSIYYLKPAESEYITKVDFNKELDNIKSTARKIENNFFPPNPGRHCSDCAFNLICVHRN